MARLWLALAFIATIAGTVLAKRAPVCTCPSDVILPSSGAIGVPTNARLWTIPASGVTATPDQRIQVYELAPHTAYELTTPRLSFATGDGPDLVPPAAPTIGGVWVTLSRVPDRTIREVKGLRISGTFDHDTAVVRIVFNNRRGDGELTYYTVPDALTICGTGLALAPDPTGVTITALDLAGNASAPVSVPVIPVIDPDEPLTCHEHHPSGTDYLAYVLLAPFVLAIAYLIGLAMTAHLRANQRKTLDAMPLAITAAEALARGIRRRAITSIAIVGGASALTFRSETVAVLMLFASPVVIVVFLVEFVRWIAAARALRLTRYEGATATACRDEVRITVGGQHATLRAAPWRVERAKEHGIPRATL